MSIGTGRVATPDPPPGPLGSVPCESEYVLGAAAETLASDTAARSPEADRTRTSSPPADATPLLISTKAVDWKIFSLDYWNLIRVRPTPPLLLITRKFSSRKQRRHG